MSTIDRAMMQANAGERLAIVLSSYRRLTGRILAPDADSLWNSPLAILAHDRAGPPAFFYANKTALDLFRMRARDMIGMPSTHSAEPDHREERAAMLQRLDRDDLVSGYQGIRIAADGTRFRISDAMIWNLIDENGQHHGQAAAIAHWEHL